VSGGGCNGLKYNVTTESSPPEKIDEDLNVEGIQLRICGKSMMFLMGTEITWVTDAMGSRMEFSNPNASSSCGCGETFSVS
jgi:iron-sulfur cluster assembly accessory protein